MKNLPLPGFALPVSTLESQLLVPHDAELTCAE
jgi:hypothetical protein